MVERNKKYYLVREDILPPAIQKTALAQELLVRGNVSSVKEAVQEVDLARSTFYKYRDGVRPFYDGKTSAIVNLLMYLEHEPGVLSRVVACIARTGFNILTLNQNIPLQGIAGVAVSLETEGSKVPLEQLINQLSRLDGVVEVDIIGRS
ncbi:MAG: ACT domain-containing protein [Syntrophomonadaceae bacterium]|jgi:chorismate mutase|nr:ACT domain-containing protein [Syntrophomonadaceae bacterium]